MKTFSDTTKNLLWFAGTEGISRKTLRNLVEKLDFSSIHEDFDKNRDTIIAVAGENAYTKLKKQLESGVINQYVDELNAKKIDVLTIFDEDYPELLKEIQDSPIILYLKGNRDLLKTDCISIVGSRNMTRYGQSVTEKFARELTSAGFTIVSGMARGIDTASHKATIDNNGNTIAVLGSGIDVVYPAENNALYEEIVKKGLVISEYPSGAKPNNYQFPERNRIIAAMSIGTLVTEAGLKSGSLITANLALEYGRELFVVPSNINSKYGEGCNELIKNASGALTTSLNDILTALGVSKRLEEAPSSMQLDYVQELILDKLSHGEAHIEELIEISQLPLTGIMSILTEMELFGLIKKLPNNMYGV